MKRTEDYLDKPLPSNDEAEIIVLGATILDNEVFAEAIKILSPEDFYNPRHRIIFDLMSELYYTSKSIDPITIIEEYKKRGFSPDTIGGATTVTNLTYGLPYFTNENLKEYVTLIKRHSIARQYIRETSQHVSALLSGFEEVEDVIAQGEASVLRLSTQLHSDNKREDKSFFTLADIAPTVQAQFEAYNRGESNGCPTGMAELDSRLDGGGLQPGGVYMVAAQEKSGKTSLALGWAYHAARQYGYTVPIITMEMSKENLFKRLFAPHSGIPYYLFRPGFHDTAQNPYFTQALQSLQTITQYSILIADRLFGFEEIARHLRRLKEQSIRAGRPMKFAVIDYLQIMTQAMQHKSREQEVSNLSRNLKKLAMELEIAIVVMSSLNREGLGNGEEPDAKNLRDSGQLAFDAEALLFLHDPLYIPGKPYERKQIADMNLIISRQRNGPTGRIKVKFIGPYMQFMTESEFARAYPNSQAQEGMPQSSGQTMSAQEDLDKLWG